MPHPLALAGAAVVAGAAVARAVVAAAVVAGAAVVAARVVAARVVAGATVVAAAVGNAWQPHTRQPHASVRKYFTVPGPQLQPVAALGAHTFAAAVVGFTVNGAMVVVAAATHEHVRQPLLSVVQVGVSVVRKHWQGVAAGHVAGAAVTTAVGRTVVGATDGAAPHVHEVGQPLASVAHVMAEPAAQSQAGRAPQRAVVGATVVVARVVAAAAVVAAAVVAATVVAAAAVVGAAVTLEAPEAPELQKHV